MTRIGPAFAPRRAIPTGTRAKYKIDVTFDPAVFCLDTVKTACYKFLDRCLSQIELSDSKIACHLAFDGKLPSATVEVCLEKLKREVLDQDLRIKLKAETEPTRNLILAHAFSQAGLTADD